MARPLTEMETLLVDDLYRKGIVWMVRQPNGDLVAFKRRPVRQVAEDKKTPWVVKHGGAVRASELPIIVSVEMEDFPRIHRTALQPSSVLDIAMTHNMAYLWEDDFVLA